MNDIKSRVKAAFITLLISVIVNGCTYSDSKKESTKSRIGISDKSAPNGLVYIPGGTFEMGGNSEQAYRDEFPVHDVKVSAFYMDETDTNAEFAEFVEATGISQY